MRDGEERWEGRKDSRAMSCKEEGTIKEELGQREMRRGWKMGARKDQVSRRGRVRRFSFVEFGE